MQSAEVLETERMVLRELTVEDVDHLMGIFSDPEAMRYYPRTKTREEVEDWVRWVRDSYEANGFGLWAAMLKDSGEFAGQCGPMHQEVQGEIETEIGYLFLRRFWGRGLATEAARACRDYCFDRLERGRVVSLIDPANLASRRVAENMGMTLEKVVWMERWNEAVCVYSVEKDEV